MLTLKKIEESLMQTLNIDKSSEAFALYKEDVIIGYGLIYGKSIKQIEIFIKEEYRSNGYGKILFGRMLGELKKKNIKNIKIIFPRENYRIKNIIISFGGIQANTNQKEDTYFLSIE